MTYQLSHPLHPVWLMARLTLASVVLCFILYINAQNFDETEHRVVLAYFSMVGAAEITLRLWIKHSMKKESEEKDRIIHELREELRFLRAEHETPN